MIQRKTQTSEYWQSFSLKADDIELLRNVLRDAEQPLTARELALALVTERCRREEADLRADMARGTIYQPKKRFALGDKVIFPAFGFRLGQVIEVRAGQNPEYGNFEVITVDFGPDRRQRTFAAGLNASHKLNAETPDLLIAGDLASPEKLLAAEAAGLPDKLAAALEGVSDFTCFEERWMLQELLAEIHVGHLNIAEAAIEMRGTAISTEALVTELDLPAEIKPELLAFSLQSALLKDGRFDRIGVGGTQGWFLQRLELPDVLTVPPALVYQPIAFEAADLPADLARLAWEIDDEWSDNPAGLVPERAAAPKATLLLTYPHVISGTLPLNRRSGAFFPGGHGQRSLVTLIDGRWSNPFQAWVNHEGRYITGLQPWFEKHKLPAGAFIVLERRGDAVVVDFNPKRMRREWTRWAQVNPEERLDVQLRKQEIACEYDEQMIIGDDKGEAGLKLKSRYAQMPLADLVFEVFSDLAGLSGTGVVHAKTVYSAVNVVRRCPPEPIFAALATDERLARAAEEHSFRLAA